MLETQNLQLMKEINLTYRTRKQQLVLIGGKAGVGKTEAAKYLYRNLFLNYIGLNISHTLFAQPIKDIARSVFGWDGNKDGKGRRLLQAIGTEAGREYNEDIWNQHLESRELSNIFPNHFVLVDDWRFPNEKSYFEGKNFYELTCIRIESHRSNLPENTSDHISENSLSISKVENLVYNNDSYYNFSIFNNGDFDEFYTKLDKVLDYLKTKIVTE